MKKTFYALFLLVFIFGLESSMLGQEKTAKPIMKITLKDGKVIDAVPLDKSGNPDLAAEMPTAGDLENDEHVISAESLDKSQKHFTILSTGVDQNSQIEALLREDTINSPDRFMMRPNPQDSEADMSLVTHATSILSETGVEADNLLITNAIVSGEAQDKPEKGQRLEVAIEPTSAVFDPSTANVRYLQDDGRDVKDNYVEQDFRPEAGWEVIMSNDFEGIFPAVDWNTYAVSGFADAYWDDNSYRANSGTWSLFCADMGADLVVPPASYPNNMNSWAVYGPFDLSDATAAQLDFELWLDSETSYDYFRYMISLDGVNFYGYNASGSTSGFYPYVFDLTTVPTLGDVSGNSQVYFALVFDSDHIVSYEGAYVDDVVLWKYAQDVDVRSTSIGLSTSSWYPGLTVTADLTEVNNGTDPAQAHYSRLYLSTNSTITTGDVQLGGDLYFSSIAAGGTQTVSGHTFTAPAVADGTYYVGNIVDIYNHVPETNEANNYAVRAGLITSSPPPTTIDIYGITLEVTTDTWSGGLSVTGTLTVGNGGTGAAGAHYSRLYLSTNDVISSTDTQLGGDLYFSSVPAGGTTAVAETFTAPVWGSGTYYMGVIMDYYDDVAESDETNNIERRGGPIYYDPDIDLRSTSIFLSTSTWVVGSSVTSDLAEVNNGIDASGAHSSRLYLSDNNTITTGDVQLGGDLNFSSIAGGGNQTVSGHTFNAPDVADGTYWVGNIVDIYDDVVETDEANNYAVRAGQITSTHPAYVDLYWSSMSLTSSAWVPGDVVTAELTETNDEVAPAGAHYSRIYLSDNTTIGTGDVQLGSDIYYSSVPGGGTVTENLTFTVPSVTAGTYYLGAMVDFYDDVAENDESNNVNYRVGTVSITDPVFTISASVQPTGSGTVSGAGSYDLNQSATLVATPATGYEFVNWTEGGAIVSTEQSYVFTVTSDRSLVANFTLITLTVTTQVNPVEGGTASGGGSYAYGSSVSLSAVPATGYEFVNWTVLAVEVSTNPTYTFTVNENTEATANFTVTTLTVTVVADPSEGGAVTGGGDYLYGESAVLAAVPADGYEFRRWADQSNVEISVDNPYSFTVEENITLKAMFVDPTGIGEYKVQDFELYPNPVGDNLYVKVNVELSESVVISLYDVSGKVVANYKGSHDFKDVLELKTSHLIPGVYFIRITDNDTDTRFTGKVIRK